jgi:hypothetical protein
MTDTPRFQPQRYRKKPVVIEAWLNADDTGPLPDWVVAAELGRQPGGVILLGTLEGVMQAQIGDYIIRGVKGEFYPCKPDIFEATYEAVHAMPASESQDSIQTKRASGDTERPSRLDPCSPDSLSDPRCAFYDAWSDDSRP